MEDEKKFTKIVESWQITRERPDIKKRIKRTAESIHKTTTLSMDSAMMRAEDAVRHAHDWDENVPDEIKPKPRGPKGYFDRGRGDEVKDKDAIIKAVDAGNIPHVEPSGKVTVPGSNLWLPKGYK